MSAGNRGRISQYIVSSKQNTVIRWGYCIRFAYIKAEIRAEMLEVVIHVKLFACHTGIWLEPDTRLQYVHTYEPPVRRFRLH